MTYQDEHSRKPSSLEPYALTPDEMKNAFLRNSPPHSSTYSTNLRDTAQSYPRYPHPVVTRKSLNTSSSSYKAQYLCQPTEEERWILRSSNGGRSINSFGEKLDPRQYKIEKISDHDDIDLLPAYRRRLYRLSPFFTLLAIVSYFTYFGYRIHCTVDLQRKSGNTYAMAWLFISAEACVACPTFLHQFYQMLSIRGRHRPKLRLRGEEVPTVDVLVTCCGEDVDVVLDTARAACGVDYPQDRFRVVILDDERDKNLKTAIKCLGSEYSNLFYHARTKLEGVPHHFKAGNLIGGTNFVTTLPGGEAEYIAALDADMIPEPHWLRAIIPHLLKDEDMGLVCPPQLFYNIPKNDPLVQSLNIFAHVMETTKDANGVAWCTGSGYAIRRKALESIGGWPVGSLSEDTYTSSLLLGSGWKTAFCHEPLQYGIVPETFIGHLKQRSRWTLGTLQTALRLNFCLFGSRVKKMGFFARFSACLFAIDTMFKVFLLLALVAIPIVLVSGGRLVAYSTSEQLRWQIRLCFISLILARINEWITYLPSGYRLAQRDIAAQMWMAPFHAMTVIRCFILPSWLGGKPMTFSSSGSIKSGLNERDKSLRASLSHRLRVMVFDCHLYIHLCYIIFVVTAITLSIARGVVDTSSLRNRLLYLLTHAFWPPCLWLIALTAAASPLRYAIFPPTMPDREHLLDRDPKTGIAHPKEYWKRQRYAKITFWHEFQYSLITIYTAVLFVGSFLVTGDLTLQGTNNAGASGSSGVVGGIPEITDVPNVGGVDVSGILGSLKR